MPVTHTPARNASPLDAALELAKAGHPVFPVIDKRPMVKGGVHAATLDTGQITEWWDDKWPHANVAIRCDKVLVLDVDPRNGGDLVFAAWEELFGAMPVTPVARTGGGGIHVYFQHCPAIEELPLGGGFDRGIDIKGNGNHYVLVPPSTSSSGGYRWVRGRSLLGDVALAPPPPWLIRLIQAVKRRPPMVTVDLDSITVPPAERVLSARRYAFGIPGAVSGKEGHMATLRAAQAIARGFALTRDEAFAVLSEWNTRACSPPWSETELLHKIDSTLTSGVMPIGSKLDMGGTE